MENKEELTKIYNKEIAKFMGYVYYHPGVEVEDEYNSSIEEIFSKVPIEVETYDDGEFCYYYFKQIANPDFRKESPTYWNSELKTLNWNSLNFDKFITYLDYNSNWESLMQAVDKIEDMGFLVTIKDKRCNIVNLKEEDVDIFVEHVDKKTAVFIAVGQFCEKFNNL